MAQKEELCTAAETKNVVNPRVEIDTSPPFESVKEAVVRFGGSGPWIPHHLLRLAPPPPQEHDEVLDLTKMEEQAVKYERDLIMKEQEALNLLKEVEAAKRFVEGLKVNLMEEVSAFVSSPGFTSENQMEKLRIGAVQSPGYVLMELDQAKLDLNKMSMDLAVIRTSVESLNKKMKKEKVLLEKSGERKSLEYDNDGSRIKPEVNDRSLEAEQFKKMAEASRYEVMKATSEIERTKASIKIAEMRLVAAKKMEEAAKAVEAIAFAERKALLNSNSSNTPEGITLPYEEYYALTQKAQQAEELCKIKFVDSTTEVTTRNKMEENMNEVHQNKKLDNEDGCQRKMEDARFYRDRTEHSVLARSLSRGNPRLRNGNEPDIVRDKPVPVFRSSISIGDILSRKLILQDDIMVGKHVESHTKGQQVSFSQMLREQSGIILNPTKSGKDGSVHKQYIAQRKKFGFIQVPIPKHNKKKTPSMNLR